MNKWQTVYGKLLQAKSEFDQRPYRSWVTEIMLLTLILLVEDKLNEKA